ncbi:MAG: sulfatase [Acidobacteriota bacterium]|nr:MAG: sulfatase [Acidobacteriota bacterium]
MATQPNIVVFMVDTLRGDLLQAKTPHLDEFASESLVFPNANSTTPSTRSSAASLFTGVGPMVHGVRHGKTHMQNYPGAMLSAELDKRGYNTLAVVANPNIDPVFGHARGFEEYITLYKRKMEQPVPAAPSDLVSPAQEVVESAAEIAGRAKKPYFLFVLAIDPHAPYGPPGSECQGEQECYRAEVEYVDRWFGWLLQRLPSDAVVVFTSDHGEEFGEHGQWRHGRNVWETSTHIPLMIRCGKKGVVTSRVDLLDLASTILVLGGGTPPEYWPGRDLTKPITTRPVVSLWETWRAVRWEGIKYLWHENKTVVFDLDQDPAETKPFRAAPVDDESLIPALRALGYVE